jgi:hypothetical protein
MTRLQRAVHRRTWLAMVVLVPLVCAWALKLRHSHARALGVAQTSTGAPP